MSIYTLPSGELYNDNGLSNIITISGSVIVSIQAAATAGGKTWYEKNLKAIRLGNMNTQYNPYFWRF